MIMPINKESNGEMSSRLLYETDAFIIGVFSLQLGYCKSV